MITSPLNSLTTSGSRLVMLATLTFSNSGLENSAGSITLNTVSGNCSGRGLMSSTIRT